MQITEITKYQAGDGSIFNTKKDVRDYTTDTLYAELSSIFNKANRLTPKLEMDLMNTLIDVENDIIRESLYHLQSVLNTFL